LLIVYIFTRKCFENTFHVLLKFLKPLGSLKP